MDSNTILNCFTQLGIPKSHSSHGLSNLLASSSQYRSLFLNRRLCDDGWSDVQIQTLLFTLSSLDTNNHHECLRRCGVGEREGRVYSSLVRNRHFGFSHGVGRSGDLAEPQPKAVGSTALARLTLYLTLDAVRRGSGLDKKTSANSGILLPLCTGMSIALTLRTFATLDSPSVPNTRGSETKNIVLWCRIDQKSCYKSILSAGFQCIIIPTKVVSDEVETNLDELRSTIQNIGKEKILAIISTTSCFAPRVPDQVDEIAKVCQSEGIYHLINNAYGLQCSYICKLINRACTVGRVDAIVCSTDKNFMVPVGGAFITSPKEDITKAIGKMYAGRASASSYIDLFITLLSMGLNGYKNLLEERNRLVGTFQKGLESVARKNNERLLVCPRNTISFGITLSHLGIFTSFCPKEDVGEMPLPEVFNSTPAEDDDAKVTNYFGSMLFIRCVSGARVISHGQISKIGNDIFYGYGSSTNEYGSSYMTAACAIGLTELEITSFLDRLDQVFIDFHKQQQREKQNI